MKKPYKNLEIEVITFEKKDVITASATEEDKPVAVAHENLFMNFWY